MAFPIKVGSAAIDRATYDGGGMTLIELANPVNLNGLITTIDVNSPGGVTNFRLGIFFLVSGVTYRCRSSTLDLGTIGGGLTTIPVSLPAQKGDFVGCYTNVGYIEMDTSGGTAYARISQEQIDPGDQADYTVLSTRVLSLYGQGIVKGWCSK